MKTINTEHGFCKMYWDLFNDENLSIPEVVAMSYIIDKYDIFRERKIIDNKEYVRVAESFVQARLSASIPTISKWLHHLADLGYFEIYQKTPKSPVWIHVNNDLITNVKTDDKSQDKTNDRTDDRTDDKNIFKQIILNTQDIKPNTQYTTTIAGVNVPESKISDLQAISDKFDSILNGTNLFRKETIYTYAAPLWAREYTTNDMLKVIDWCNDNWSDEIRKNIGPKSCFNEYKFDERLGKTKIQINKPFNPTRPNTQQLKVSDERIARNKALLETIKIQKLEEQNKNEENK